MLVPICKISFEFDSGSQTNSLEFDFVNEIEIVKSRKTLTNTCTIKLPRKIKVLEGRDLNDVLRRGARVSVELGYSPEIRKEFVGYVSKVDTMIPFTVYCEDEMWRLKQNSFTKSWKTVSLKEVVKFIYNGFARVADIQLGGLVIKQQTTAQVLESLKKFGLRSYFETDGVLVVDFASSLRAGTNRVVYDFNVNVIDNDLVLANSEDMRIKVKGISKQPNGKLIEILIGDIDGDLRTLNFYNLSKAALQKVVKEEIDRLKQNGLKNSFTTFGQPYIEPGDTALLRDKSNLERNGSYLVDEVTTTFGLNGFRRKITLERKLA